MEPFSLSFSCSAVSRNLVLRNVDIIQHVAHAFGIAWVIIESKEYVWTQKKKKKKKRGGNEAETLWCSTMDEVSFVDGRVGNRKQSDVWAVCGMCVVLMMLPFWEVVTLVGIPRHREDPGIKNFWYGKTCREQEDDICEI